MDMTYEELRSAHSQHIDRGVLGNSPHKNLLQQYAQRSGAPLPAYSTLNEGEPHDPKFRSTVLVDGMKFTSPNTFSRSKEAEKDVAKLALECLSMKFKNECSLNIRKDKSFCKSILNEFATELRYERPTYTITQQNEPVPIFFATVTFEGKSYAGYGGRSKMEAERNAACAAIDFILANSSTGSVAMTQIIKAKGKRYAIMKNSVNAGNVTVKSEIETDDNDTFGGAEQMALATNVTLPSESTSWVPYALASNQMNHPALPMSIAESLALLSRKRKKKSKNSEQSKKTRADEQPSSIAAIP